MTYSKAPALVLKALIIGLTVAIGIAAAHETPQPAYLDTDLAPEARAADLVHRMTLDEKASQLVD